MISLSRKIKQFITIFFNLLIQRSFSSAEKELRKIKQRAEPTQWYNGYINALEGMLTALKSDERKHAFINRIERSKINEHKKEFLSRSKKLLHTEFDRGFFTAWADYTRILGKLPEKKPS